MSFPLDDAERAAWTNLPATLAPRQGMAFGDMTDSQLGLVHTLWAAGYSSTGWERAQGVIDNEAYNQDLGDVNSDVGDYYITMFDEPSETDPWAVQLDGHHLVANFSVVGDRYDLVPAFWGVSPTEVLEGRFKGLRPLGDVVDAGLAFMQSIEAFHDQALVSEQDHGGMLAGGGNDERIPETATGVSGADLSQDQRDALMEVIRLHVEDLQSTQAAERMAEIEAGMEETYFAWFGPISDSRAWYFRIHGPSVWIELDHVTATHVHIVYRDPKNDYGADWLSTHRSEHPHPHP